MRPEYLQRIDYRDLRTQNFFAQIANSAAGNFLALRDGFVYSFGNYIKIPYIMDFDDNEFYWGHAVHIKIEVEHWHTGAAATTAAQNPGINISKGDPTAPVLPELISAGFDYLSERTNAAGIIRQSTTMTLSCNLCHNPKHLSVFIRGYNIGVGGAAHYGVYGQIDYIPKSIWQRLLA